jgi:RimJ/RimL family protein N-acetyltransferase
MLGSPLFADRAVPSFEQFCEEYLPHYFDGTRPFDGRAFLIRAEGAEIGFVSHGPINLFKDVVEVDLWLAGRRFVGRGYGSDALETVCGWLQARYGVNRFLSRPSRRNVHGLRAMRRAGFRETDLDVREVVNELSLSPGHYGDQVLMFRILPLPDAALPVLPDHTYVFIDSEFTTLTDPRLISLGAVATDATAFYCELADVPAERCSEFVRSTVLPLLDGRAVSHPVAAQSFETWLAARAAAQPTIIVSDSGFDRWAMADLLGREDLPPGVRWVRVPIDYEQIDEVASSLGLRRHHALDDARALRHIVLNGPQ